jgi:hypothetical protein
VYSSAFQTLKIFNTYSVTTTKPASGTNTITITHSLGYIAPFVVIYNGNSTTGQDDSFFMNDNSTPWLTVRQYTNTLEIDIDEYFDADNAVATDTVYFTVYLFLDDFRTVAENNISTGTSKGADSTDYGIRISKDGYDVKTCTDEQCVLSSSFFNNIVHKKGTVNSVISPPGSATTVSHNLGYVPNFLAFIKYDGNSYMEYDGRFMTSSSTKITLNPLEQGGDNTYYYIIFKDKVE